MTSFGMTKTRNLNRLIAYLEIKIICKVDLAQLRQDESRAIEDRVVYLCDLQDNVIPLEQFPQEQGCQG